jgi:hypothetical protein
MNPLRLFLVDEGSRVVTDIGNELVFVPDQFPNLVEVLPGHLFAVDHPRENQRLHIKAVVLYEVLVLFLLEIEYLPFNCAVLDLVGEFFLDCLVGISFD